MPLRIEAFGSPERLKSFLEEVLKMTKKKEVKNNVVNTFTSYMKQILETNEVSSLKKLSHEIYQSQNLNKIEKSALIRAYKARKAELYRNIITNSQSRLFKALYFLIKKSPAPEAGVVLYEVKDRLTKEEADILFDLYERVSVGVEKENNDVTATAELVETQQPSSQVQVAEVEPF